MTLPIHPELGTNFDYDAGVQELKNAIAGTHAAPAAAEIAQQVIQLGVLLLKKNAAYGDAALAPVEVFARGLKTSERLGVRMDDKISRLAKGSADGEDPEMDLAGYLVLKRIALAREAREPVALLGVALVPERPKPTPGGIVTATSDATAPAVSHA